MNFLIKIISTQDYCYFDQYHQLQTKPLNIFQRFFRRAFGCYVETHLSSVVKKAYSVTLNDQFQDSFKKRQLLLKLIAKGQRIFGYNQSYMQISDFSSENKVKIGVIYEIKTPKNPNENYEISSVDFKLNFTEIDHDLVSIFKNRSNRLVINLPIEFQASREDYEALVKRTFTSEKIKVITALLAKILKDSLSPEVADIHYYAIDYRFKSGSPLNIMSGSSPDPNDLNRIREDEITKLGWEYLHQFTESGHGGIKSVFILRKEINEAAQKVNSLRVDRALSLAFAATSLETKPQEFFQIWDRSLSTNERIESVSEQYKRRMKMKKLRQKEKFNNKSLLLQ